MASNHQQDWPNVIAAKGWTNVSAKGVSLNADLNGCVDPGWINHEELPSNVQGGVFSDVSYRYGSSDAQQPPECPPNVVYVPQRVRSSQDAFKQLHARCLKDNVALKLATVASTPNLQVALILVAGYTQQQQQQQPSSGASAGGAAAVPQPGQLQPAGRRCMGSSRAAAAGSNSRAHVPQDQLPSFKSCSGASSFCNVGPAHQTPPRSGQQHQQQQRAAGSDCASLSYSGAAAPAAPHQAATAAETVAMARASNVEASMAAARGGTTAAQGAAEATSGGAGGVAAAATAAGGAQAGIGRPLCLYAYFVPLRPGRDLGAEVSYDKLLKRRWSERRGKDKGSRDIIEAWREDLGRLRDRDRSTGMPTGEQQRVIFHGYWDKSSSSHAMPGGGPRMHCSLVRSVLPGHTFMYSTRPWRPKPDDPLGALEPDNADQLPGFLEECRCSEHHCGKLKARKELTQLREEGVQYGLEVRLAGRLQSNNGGRGDLGVFAAEDIPAETYLCEYVGEWLQDADEPRRREAAYGPAGLHFMYTLIEEEDAEGDVPRVVDATHLGNVARFVNHRCEGANLVAIKVCMGGQEADHMTIVLRATRDIQAGEELTLDYMAGKSAEDKEAIRANPKGAVKCMCGAAKCLGVVFPYEKDSLGQSSGRRNAACTRRFAPPPPAAAAAAHATTAAASASSSDSGGSYGAVSGDAAADTGAATAVAAGNLAEECPFAGDGVGEPAAAAAAAARAEETGQQGRGRTAAAGMVPAAAAAAAAAAEEEEHSCASSVSGGLRSRVGAAEALHRAPSGQAGCAAAAVVAVASPRAQGRGGVCASGADAAAAAAAVAAAAAAAAVTGARRLSPSESPGRLKRMRLARPPPPT